MPDIVVFGATSFVGQIVAHRALEEFGADGSGGPSGNLRWAIAGRARAKLDSLRAALGPAAARLPVVVADASDRDAMRALCREARVVVSTVGPYALYGEPLLQACAETGTDYVDLTGEVPWMRRMIERYEAAARASGARIVHCCGFDSIPSDLGVHVLEREALRRFGVPLKRVRLRVRKARGGVSGGTVASLLNVLEEAGRDSTIRATLADPYSLCVGRDAPTVRQPDVTGAAYDEAFGAWVTPFVMAPINTRVVHRSNALSGWRYGRDFLYDEAVLAGRGWRGRFAATGTALCLGAFLGAASIGPLRALLRRTVLPKPGDGPSPATQERGFFDLRLHGVTADGRSLRGTVTGDRDPGYGSTARMLLQSAACLAADTPKEALPGGFWTPATAFGDRLVQRLEARAGLTFTVEQS
jgi:short subunit dehydrogenase-like uncharacterized protein